MLRWHGCGLGAALLCYTWASRPLRDNLERAEERQAALKTNAETQKAWADTNDLPKAFAPKHGQNGRGLGPQHRGPGMMGGNGGQQNGGNVQEDNG